MIAIGAITSRQLNARFPRAEQLPHRVFWSRIVTRVYRYPSGALTASSRFPVTASARRRPHPPHGPPPPPPPPPRPHPPPPARTGRCGAVRIRRTPSAASTAVATPSNAA